MSHTFDICIRGAGIVGRTLALQLASKRLRVALVSSATANPHLGHSDVRAYALNASSRALLESVRCWPDEQHATAVLSMQVHGDSSGQVTFSAQEQESAALNWIVDVPSLENLLAEAVKFQPLIEVVNTPMPAALTVVCEGKASSTRTEFGVEFDVTPYDQWAIAARVQCALGHQQIARQWFSDTGILALLPLGGAAGKECAVVWSVAPSYAEQLRAMPAQDFCVALQATSHQALGDMSLSSERATWPLQQAQARHWCGTNDQGAWVLAGDAAHNVHPLAGQGLNLGLGDVAELATILDERSYWRTVNDTRLLRHYERARKADFAVIGQAGDTLQQLFSHPHPVIQTLRNWGMNRFHHSGVLKAWVARRAMGTKATT